MKRSILTLLSLITASSLSLSAAVGIASAQQSSSQPATQVKHLTESSFRTDVLAAKQPVLVDFYAPWCGACKSMDPVLEGLSKSYNGKVAVAKVNIDDNPDLAGKYGVSSIPSIKLFKNGRVVAETLGAVPEARLREKIDRAL